MGLSERAPGWWVTSSLNGFLGGSGGLCAVSGWAVFGRLRSALALGLGRLVMSVPSGAMLSISRLSKY